MTFEDDPEQIPKNWADIPLEQRKEIMRMVKSRIWWRGLSDRLSWAKGPITGILAVLTLWTLAKEGLLQWLQNHLFSGGQ